MRATNPFHTRSTIPIIENSCNEKDASNKEHNYLIFLFLYLIGTISLLNHRQTLIQLKSQALLKFPAVCGFSGRKYQPTKKQFCHDSEKCKYEKLGEFSPKSSMSSVINAAGHSCFIFFAPAIRENILTSVQDFFVCFKQPIKKFKLIRNSHVPRALRFSCQGRAG